jgi:hypothetical protein
MCLTPEYDRVTAFVLPPYLISETLQTNESQRLLLLWTLAITIAQDAPAHERMDVGA